MDTRDFAGPDLGLNCIQYFPVDETIVDKVFKHRVNRCLILYLLYRNILFVKKFLLIA